MTDVAKRRSAFIANIPPMASLETLKLFLLQELETHGQNRDHLLKVIFPISTSNPGLALVTFHDEKAMVALMQKQLIFEGEVLTMQPFLSKIFSCMTAVVNPDVTDLFPFGSEDFSRLLEDKASVNCHHSGENDNNQGLPVPLDRNSQELYTITGNWYQLQNARKFLQEWVVSDANRPEMAPRDSSFDDKKSAASSSRLDFPKSRRSHPVKEPSHERNRVSEKLTNGHDSRTVGSIEVVPKSNLESSVAATVPKKKHEGKHVVDEFVASSVRDNKQDTVFREKRESASLVPDMNSLENGPNVDRNEGTSRDNSTAKSLPGHPNPSEAVSEDKWSLEDGQRISLKEQETSVPGNNVHGESPVSMENMGVTDSLRRDGLPSGSTNAEETFPSVFSERSDTTTGSSIDYMKGIKMPPTSLGILQSEASSYLKQFEGGLQVALPPEHKEKDEETPSSEDDLKINSPEPVRSSHIDEQSEGLGSLPVDPGVFSYILLKKSDSIREIEEKHGVKFSMHATKDGEDSDVESALLKIEPTRASAEIAPAHDEFVDFYSYIFSALEYRVITAAELAFDPESISKTVDQIHDLYQTVLLTVSNKKICIYGLDESDIRLAKECIIDASRQANKSRSIERSGHHLSTIDRVGRPRALSDTNAVTGYSGHYFTRGEIDSPTDSDRISQPRPPIDGSAVNGYSGHSFARGEVHTPTEDHTTVDGYTTPVIASEKNLKSLTRKKDDPSSTILEVDSGPKTYINGPGLVPLASKKPRQPTAHFIDEAVDYQRGGAPRRSKSATSRPDTFGNVDQRRQPLVNGSVTTEIAGTSGSNVSDDTSSQIDVIPVDPGVFAFIEAHKHAILCDIEKNYGITFNVKGSSENDVCMVEVKPVVSASATAVENGKEAFANFYSEVFQGLHHRVQSLGEFENISRDELEDIVQEMEHSFNDLLFRVVGSKVMIYGQGRHNVESARDLIEERLRRSLETSRMDSVIHSDESTLLESLGSDAFRDRLNRLREDLLSPDTLRREQTRTLTQNLDSQAVHRELETDTINPNSEASASPEEADLGNFVSRHVRASPPDDTKYVEKDGHLEMPIRSRNADLIPIPHDESKAKALKTPSEASTLDKNDNPTKFRIGKDLNRKTEDVSFRFDQENLIMDLSSGIRIQVHLDDITKIDVDAIVNAANERLYNIAGVARAIHRAAGDLVQAACNRYIARRGLLHPAKVIHTEAGNLPCRFVLHAVGPRWSEYPHEQQCRETLRTTVFKCLCLAGEKLQVSSLAMPFISSGIFGVPLDICVEEICEALTLFNQRQLTSPNSILHNIHIIDIDRHNIRKAQEIMIRKLCPDAANYQTTVTAKDASGAGAYLKNVRQDDHYRHDLQEKRYLNDDAVLVSERREISSGRKNQVATLGSLPQQTKESSSSDEDVPYRSLRNEEKGVYNGSFSGSAMVRSRSLPYLARGDLGDEDRWAYGTGFKVSHGGSDSEKIDFSEERKRSREVPQDTKTAPLSKDKRREVKVQEILDTCTRSPLSSGLSRQAEYELDRLLSKQERRTKEKQSKPARRTQSLDRTRHRPKCFVCYSNRNLVMQKNCDHYICELCKAQRVDVNKCKECTKTKTKEEKKCDLCFSSKQNSLVNCTNCYVKQVCLKCFGKRLKLCRDCMDQRAGSSRQKEMIQPKLREPITTTRLSRCDTKNDYRIKSSNSGATEARKKPMRGLNQPLNLVGQSYETSSRSSGSEVAKTSTGARQSAFSKEVVTEEAPHEQVLKRLSRDQENRPSLKHGYKNLTMVTDDNPQRKQGRPKKPTLGKEERKIVGDGASSGSKPKCVICMDDIKDPKSLSKCQHTFCSACIDKSLQFKPVCPICGVSYGKLRGNQPQGTMNYSRTTTDLPGHQGCGTIIITYNFPDGVQNAEHPHPGVTYRGTYREAYLPNSREGQDILALLKKAFDARLLFTVGRSVTTGRDDVVVWNDVHHKTQQTGGATRHGYPDPSYLQRVREELKAKGIE